MPEQPDPLADAFQTLYDLIERYGGERTQEQHEMWWQVENAMEELAEQGIAEGRRQSTEGWERQWGARHADGDVYAVEEGEGEKRARNLAAWPKDRPGTVVSRLVGPWETAEQSELVVPCDNEREPDGDRCTGEIRYMPGDAQAACGTCGGWRGRFAPATGGVVDSAPACRVEVVKSRSAGWCWRCHTCDVTHVNLTEETARREAAEHSEALTLRVGKPEDGGR